MRALTRIPFLAIVVGSLTLPAMPAMAQPIPGAVLYTVVIPAGEFGSAAFTSVVVGGLAAAKEFCAGLGEAYRVDCLAERFSVLSASIPKNSDYGEVRQVLRSASNRMASLARKNRSRDLPRGRATSPGFSETTTRPLTPVNRAATVEVNRKAQAILAQTETLLLRSAGESRSKTLHYTQIASAIGSNKVLLRSV